MPDVDGLRYPNASDLPDGPGAFFNLATDTDTRLDAAIGTRQILSYRPADLTALNALAGMSNGDFARRTDNGITYKRVSGAWKEWESDWISWATPPTNLVVGTGGSASSVQQYKWINGRAYFFVKYILGTSGFSVGVNPLINLPFSLVRPITRYPQLGGYGSYYNATTTASAYAGNPRLDQLTANQVVMSIYTGTYAGITSTAPWTWAANHELHNEFWGDPQ